MVLPTTNYAFVSYEYEQSELSRCRESVVERALVDWGIGYIECFDISDEHISSAVLDKENCRCHLIAFGRYITNFYRSIDFVYCP